MRRIAVLLVLLGVVLAPASSATEQPGTLTLMHDVNAMLAARGLNVEVAQVEFFTIGEERPITRLHQQGFRYVANDERRAGGGAGVSYLVDSSDGATASGLTSAQTEAAIDRAVATWRADKCLSKVALTKAADDGRDPDLLDGLFDFGDVGEPRADIVNGGWLPRGFFEAWSSGGGRSTLALTFTFVFTDDDGNETDVDGDNYDDAAFSEIYYNDNFGAAAGDRPRNPWRIDAPLPAIDVQSVALHENGHALGLGHFGPQPKAVMNAGYQGLEHELHASDHAGMCAIWSRSPAR